MDYEADLNIPKQEKRKGIDIYKEYNRPTGEVWRKYSRIWDAYITDLYVMNIESEIADIEIKGGGGSWI